ncbi:hypothetical protein LSH36_427g07011 [Paralvinella palmiformis]|uniref:Secreted protein n=1 Tax=Paralvinella palmiformis TaxID=53620 RepID=A0AAD9N0S8_9ANNE|nr:hypothetical protein LSH36_427g07011 [Paralvinella palmiformis]
MLRILVITSVIWVRSVIHGVCVCVCVCQCGCVRHGVLYSLSGNGHLSVSQSASESVFVEFVHGESSVLPIVGE